MRLFGRGVGGFAPSSIVRYCFFFSSRRRHTRCSRDWSSDVCSSDLQFGKKIAIHSYGPAGARDAVRAGTDSLEHATDMDDATIAEMAKHGTFYVPTIDHNRYYIDNGDKIGYAPGYKEKLQAFIPRNLETARKAFKAGRKFTIGSDAIYTMFGQNTRELGWFVKAGMTPEQALGTATSNAAELLGKEKELGAVAPGFFADLVAVEGDRKSTRLNSSHGY